MRKFQATLMIHKLAITKAVLYSVVSLGTSWQIATEGKVLDDLTKWQWFSIFVGITVIWGNNMMSFLDKVTSRISEGKSPFETGATEFLQKQKENG